jgi:hypothetical protein
MYDRNKNCGRCGSWTHLTAVCGNKNPDCNEDGGAFHTSNKGKQWWQDRKLGPFVHQSLDFKGRTYKQREPAYTQHQQQNQCEFSQMLLTTITQDVLNVKSPNLDYQNSSDFLTMTISLPIFQTAQPVAKTRKRLRATKKETGINKSSLTVQALLDSGCLTGDCISQEIVNKLNAKHLIVHTNTTICSGFNNECNDNFPS